MENRKPRRPSKDPYELSAAQIGTWIMDNLELLAGLRSLRALGECAENAVAEVEAVKEIRRVRLGWELWDAMVRGEGRQPQLMLLKHVPFEVLELAEDAFWPMGDEEAA
jgi:hypothetical protein